MKRLFAAGAVLALSGTYLAARLDFARRHQIGIDPRRFWLPQLTHVWLPGLGLAIVLGVASWLSGRHRPG